MKDLSTVTLLFETCNQALQLGLSMVKEGGEEGEAASPRLWVHWTLDAELACCQVSDTVSRLADALLH